MTTKAKQVRNIIANAKSAGYEMEAVIQEVMAATGFRRQLARAYVNNNWDKVETLVAVVPVVELPVEGKPAKTLSMTKDAIRKREARAAAKAAKEAVAA
jgi:hypothetical protein